MYRSGGPWYLPRPLQVHKAVYVRSPDIHEGLWPLHGWFDVWLLLVGRQLSYLQLFLLRIYSNQSNGLHALEAGELVGGTGGLAVDRGQWWCWRRGSCTVIGWWTMCTGGKSTWWKTLICPRLVCHILEWNDMSRAFEIAITIRSMMF